MNEKANYGNWVPEKALYMLFGASVLLGVIAVLAQTVLDKPVVTTVAGVLCVLTLIMAVYMLICHETFAFGKGNMMEGVHEHLVEHLDWNGEGRLLDIGCGVAALTVRCAKVFPKAQITAMDYWGAEWNYAKEQCERNAQIEGVADRISFQKGDAAKLDFRDETFDAAVSNFVFHEVRTAKDKRDVVKEALRVVKKGGAFSFQDMFSQKALYGDMEQFVRELKAEGISEVHYIGNLEKKLDFIPGFVTTPWMISGMGIIYGRK
ncbi:class I SAM-dependent methyltransferase [Blautia sp. MSJ-19]|uniref:class I SAM-dependent methyltransferase n=1 Tax=Blautia sp. MSJ-19 TaxID=2841517 RepID=UPI001C0ED18A|nr:class I SAM-dependent methyltransferase [Blautia sp. MSJ-19]MBU5480712.1 class I SAM-dependent methyltransferase [Blautia sp. MSJ-19]